MILKIPKVWELFNLILVSMQTKSELGKPFMKKILFGQIVKVIKYAKLHSKHKKCNQSIKFQLHLVKLVREKIKRLIQAQNVFFLRPYLEQQLKVYWLKEAKKPKRKMSYLIKEKKKIMFKFKKNQVQVEN